jgi:glucose/arabinose dehydrogenase
MRANPDGSDLELIAWGLRNPFRIKFDKSDFLFSTNHGMDERGSRPVANSPDEFLLINPGVWYGWPDFTGGFPVTLPYFKPDNAPQPEFLLVNNNLDVPKPFSTFTPHSAIMGFDFSFSDKFGNPGDVYIAEFGSAAPETTGGKPLPDVGHRISNIDMTTGNNYTFAVNKSGFAASYTNEGGFERPIDVVFSKNDEMFIADFGLSDNEGYIPETGVIWKINRI